MDLVAADIVDRKAEAIAEAEVAARRKVAAVTAEEAATARHQAEAVRAVDRRAARAEEEVLRPQAAAIPRDVTVVDGRCLGS